MADFLDALRDLLARLSKGDGEDAYHDEWTRLLHALVGDTQADASTLMVMDQGSLRPVAVLGLPDDVRGRPFRLQEHPRLAAIAAHPGICRFPPDSELPDPFDGLLDEEMSQVHDCLGVALRDGDRLIGLLTLDALNVQGLANLDEGELLAAARLLGTCLRVAEQLSTTRQQLSEALEEEQRSAPLQQWHSPVMGRLMNALSLVAPTDMSVLLHGETGVGKEAVARALHARSQRHRGPLVQVNCAALPEHLIESELFGHRRGAFSGAHAERRGHFAMADGGTLMLDEVGELPLSLQPKLLRALQEGEIQPLGSERAERIDVRIIAVTNRDLSSEVEAGRFREDLYHRLNAFPLAVPPLRERPEDISLLAGHFLEVNRIRLGVANLRLDADAMAALTAWQWPGNIRELEHTLGRAALRALGEQGTASPQVRRQSVLRLSPHHLALPDLPEGESHTCGETPAIPPGAKTATPSGASALPLREATDDFQRRHIQAHLEAKSGNWAATARGLGIDPGNLHRLARRLGLKD
ncbi:MULTISPECIES: nitric oxide reductase transcriptional regulator NorR [Halomonadaceae]|uniref:nitric oxide reductase transcriptional regulator NorR n=1 Tax=Halomonadaceae TaxID=28256 RepID=UPI0015816286|nr:MULTISPECIES: nitric oxide reductase transcriptional regulator NorR [Halomonas]MDI4639341.1 nitric oxide reductase transcriptional regulator NorR [Halomonas sp. BMC7]NUJ60332.1 nitric oxide reductase transcriptional regulator NorR [Halomonas taeanensis]